MKLFSILESQQTDKPRPPKTLWFDTYSLWVQDIMSRFPEAKAYKDRETGDVIASNMSGDESYGVWRPKRNLGVSYATTRPIYTTIHPRSKLDRMEK